MAVSKKYNDNLVAGGAVRDGNGNRIDTTYAKIANLAGVATSGSYNDLTNKPVVDQTYDGTSANAQSGIAVAEAISGKQDTLVSGTNIKTINNTSLLGSGNIAVQETISDLATIRSGASAGATAVQPATLNGYVAKSEVWYDSTSSTLYIGVAQS